MILLVDGFNLIYKLTWLEDHMHRGRLDSAMRGLLETLHEYTSRQKKSPAVYVFFDGKKNKGDETNQEEVSGMQVYYSHDLSADFLIEQYIKSARSPGEIWLVSSDKKLVEFARRRKVHHHTAEAFAKMLVEGPAPNREPDKDVNPRVTPKDVDFWARMFREGKK